MAGGWRTKAWVAQRIVTVGVWYLWERLRGAKAVQAGDVPGRAEDMTTAWLTAVLCKDIPGGAVLDFSLVGGSSGTSERRGLTLVLNDAARAAGLPEHMFTKATKHYRQRLLLGFSGIIIGEAGFYPTVRPHLAIEAPRGFHACYDPRSWRSMVLLDDLARDKGAKFISTETYFTQDMMKDLLANMAVWHGKYWNSPELEGSLRWLRTPLAFMTRMNEFVAFKKRCLEGVEIAKARIPPEVAARTEALFPELMETLAWGSTGAQTFLHGDPHAGQAYITGDGRMGYSDWQIVMRGSWAFDYTYAVGTALTVADRRLWERDLLRFYLERLRATGGDAPEFDEAWSAYRRHLTYGYFSWLFTVVGASKGTAPEMQPRQVALDIIERMSHAIADLGVGVG